MDADLIIAGGGPAGLATAIAARQRGLGAIVLERRHAPLDKACGEGLMPRGVEALRALGAQPAPHDCAPFDGIRYLDAGAGVVAQARFRAGRGLGVRRTALVAALRARAAALGAELCDGTGASGWSESAHGVSVRTDRGELRGRYLIGADGLHSRVRRAAGLAGAPAAGPRRFGVRQHFYLSTWSSLVEVHWAEGVEAYVTPVAPQLVGVALLWSGGRGGFDALLARFPALCARLRGASPASAVRGAGPFAQPVRARARGRVALVGDAAGYLDPLTGEGLTLGLRCAQALVAVLASGRPLRDYELAYRVLSRSYYGSTRMLLALARRPRLRRSALRALARHPQLFERALAWVSGGPAERPSAPGIPASVRGGPLT